MSLIKYFSNKMPNIKLAIKMGTDYLENQVLESMLRFDLNAQ